MPNYRCYFIFPEDKAEACYFVDCETPHEAAQEAAARHQGTGYAAIEVWDGIKFELSTGDNTRGSGNVAGRLAQDTQVLIVDDEIMVRRLTADLLRDDGFTVTEATSPQEVLDRCASGLKFKVLLTDVRMPEISGFELANRLAVADPAIKVVYMTGFPVQESTPLDVVRPGAEVLQKPVRIAQLASAIRRAMSVR